MKLKMLRDEMGSCICEDCSYFSTTDKICVKDRRQADSADACKDFNRAYGVHGDSFECFKLID